MTSKEIAALILGSAVVGAAIDTVVSSVFTLLGQRWERVARQKELVFKTSVDLSKAYMERLVKKHDALIAVPDVVVLVNIQDAVKEVFHQGTVTRETMKRLQRGMNFETEPD
jgi:hypothetical protein